MTIWCPGKLVNPLNVSGLGLWKHRRWARTRKEAAEMCILAACGRQRDWSPRAPKRVTFTAYVWNLFDAPDGLAPAIKPMRDALMSMKLIDDDGPRSGHEFLYRQVMSRGKQAKRGVEITVTARPEET